MAGNMKTINSKPIINITILESLLNEAIEYKFQQRLDNGSQAICQLIKMGLDKANEEVKNRG